MHPSNLNTPSTITVTTGHMRSKAKRPNPCECCRKHSRKCDLMRPNCNRCAKRGVECVYLDVSPKSGHQCGRCKKLKKKCDQTQPACGRCSRADVACEYLVEPDLVSTAFCETSPPMSLSPVNSPVSAVAPMPITVIPAVDQELLPTFHDFILLRRFVNLGKMSPAMACDLDIDNFVTSFFSEHPALRAVLVAYAAKAFRSELGDWKAWSYFRRAKTTVKQYEEAPSLRVCQALFFLSQLAESSGLTDYSDKVFNRLVGMLHDAGLTQDPDSPSWAVCNLPEWQKEEMRCVFWRSAYWIKLRRTFRHTDLPTFYSLDVFDVRLPHCMQQSPFKVMTTHADFDVKTRTYHTQIPYTVRDMIVSQELLDANVTLMDMLSQIPAHMILVPNPFLPLSHKFQLFFNQMIQFCEISQYSVISLTLSYHTSLALLHRPRVYLLAFLKPTSFYITSLQYAAELESSLHVATQTAQHMAHIFAFLLLTTRDYALETNLGETLYLPRIFKQSMWTWKFAFAAMEAATMLWFVLARVPVSWRERVAFDEEAARAGLLAIREFLVLVEANLRGGSLASPYGSPSSDSVRADAPTVVTPILQCVQAMVAQVFELDRQYHSLDAADFAMTVFDLSADGDLVPIKKESPFAVMGLLGVDVAGIRWNAPYEEGWSQWWANVNLLPE
ncbi:hypothetical protein BC830DRAFT_312939 [Chytriomyces sp. MP71]|nr:hypothetical protein BC830DRAFT_312939 [Chytriomyces sp. MP71]